MTSTLLAGALVLGSEAMAMPSESQPVPGTKLADGIYPVSRQAAHDKDVLPMKEDEAIVVNSHRYMKYNEKEPTRILVVRVSQRIALDLANEPRGDKEGAEATQVLLKLKPPAAQALARLTRDHIGQQLAIVLDGEAATVHKIRGVIVGGEVQITSCAPRAAGYLLRRLRAIAASGHQEPMTTPQRP